MRTHGFFNHFPPELRAQILFGWREGGDDKRYAGKRSIARKFLAGKMTTEYATGVAKYKRITIKDERPKQRFKAEYVDRMVNGWRFLLQGKLSDASEVFSEIARDRQSKEPIMAAWHYYLAAHAHYVGHRHQGSSLDVKGTASWLKHAYELGRTGWFSRLLGVITYIEGGKAEEPSVSAPEALEVKRRVADNWKGFRDRSPEDEKGKPGTGVHSKWDRITASIREGTHGEILHEMEGLLRMFGYDRIVREKGEGENVDLIAYAALESPRHILVIEVKSRKDPKSESQVRSKEVDQVVSDAKAQEKAGSLYEKILPVILTNRESVHHEALQNAEKTKVRIVPAETFIEFLGRYLELMERFWRFVDADQEESMIAGLPSPCSLLPLFEFKRQVLATSRDVDEVFGTGQLSKHRDTS